jgi:NADH:ubiquinone oxidoreductase subunit 2 (subunit N)
LVLIQNGGWWWVLVAVIGVNTIVSAFYYFRVIRPMYLEAGDAPAFTPGPLGTGLGVACAVVLVLLLVGWGPLTNVTTAYSRLRDAAPPPPAPPATQPTIPTPSPVASVP